MGEREEGGGGGAHDIYGSQCSVQFVLHGGKGGRRRSTCDIWESMQYSACTAGGKGGGAQLHEICTGISTSVQLVVQGGREEEQEEDHTRYMGISTYSANS